jgi:DNA (cytosine-5)-methyltransferase 1
VVPPGLQAATLGVMCVSWHFLQEQAEASWEGACLDGAPFALLKLISIAGASYSLDSVTRCSPDSRSGMISEPLTVVPGEGRLMSFLADSPARTSVQQAPSAGCPASVQAFGLKCSELLVRFGLRLSSPKTHRTCALEGLAPFCRDLPAWGMTHAGECWELGTRALPIGGTECGSWPTPTAGDAKSSGSRNTAGSKAHAGVSLTDAVRGDSGKGRMSPAPTASESKGARSAVSVARGGGQRLCAGSGGKLNPPWVEWLMGCPIGWTDCAPLETGKFRQWLRSHGGPYPQESSMIRPSDMRRSATITADGRYCLKLSRTWDPSRPRALWVLLHAGEGDSERCDMTTAACVGFSDQNGFGSLMTSALHAIRRAVPVDLWGGPHPEERAAMIEQACLCSAVVLAWGHGAASSSGRDLVMREAPGVIALFDRVLPHLPRLCLGVDVEGLPLSPKFLPATTRLQPYPTGPNP